MFVVGGESESKMCVCVCVWDEEVWRWEIKRVLYSVAACEVVASMARFSRLAR